MMQAGDASPIFDLHFFCPALPGAFVGLIPIQSQPANTGELPQHTFCDLPWHFVPCL
jgi:hypothetical protein